MLVYRIEHTNGEGAFGAGLARIHDRNCHDTYRRAAYDHPGPRSEYGTPLKSLFDGYGYYDYLFACQSKTQLRSWFGSRPGRRAMAKAGGVMVTYEVPDDAVAKGKTQVAFLKSRATKLSSVPADQW
ncbi:hypothetical protein [Neorhizobium sp. S3-V5DH]|uniref:hypothetical protein n=1 Tax=Neorhizobium sp. S3-V5DH TaxID=2485166 RepID=UPI0010479FC8|nr:hypothetical protein [Neorhizobium sp. S3-V5DH]TCV62293.1 hypothetical protein EDE09_12457 [Neorhizobium sp. S3-V5DH]